MKPETSVGEIHEKEGPPPPWRGPTKVKLHRDYSRGSLREAIARVETEEELEELSQAIGEVDSAHLLSGGTRRKLAKVFMRKKRELATQLIKHPPKKRLLIPGHMARGGSLIVKPGEEGQ